MSSLRIENIGWQGQETPTGKAGVRGQSSAGEPMSAGTTDQSGGPKKQESVADQGMGMLPMMAIFAIAVWFLIIRPQQKQEKKRKAMLEALKKGDKVITTGGLHGTVHEIAENTVIIDLGPVNLTVSRSAITQVPADEPADAK